MLLLSSVALATMWVRPHLQEPERRRVVRVPGWWGAQSVQDNLAPRFIFVLMWVGVPVASVLAGDLFRLFSPWRALARGVAWLAAAGGRRSVPEPLPYPDRLGHWPAVVGVLAFVWLELIYADRDDPSTLGVLVPVYAAVQLVGMSLYGIDRWTDRGDALGVLFGLFARLSPWERRGGVLCLRRPLAGAPALPVVGGTVAAYLLAHYFSLLAYEGQAVSFLASDPLGRDWNLFGTANAAIDYGVIGATGIWYVQVAALVVGHVSGLVLAHDRALALYGQGRNATRSQCWMLVVMVGFTSLGLWLLSALDPT